MLDLTLCQPLPGSRLRPLRPAGRHRTHVLWLCLCDPALGGCGRECVVSSNLLRRSSVRSCGCLRREVAAAKGRRQQPSASPALIAEMRSDGEPWGVVCALTGLSRRWVRELLERSRKRKEQVS